MNGSEKTRLQHCLSALFPNAGDVDRLQKARDYGCNVGKAATVKELVEILGQWGVDRVQAACTIDHYDRVVRLGQTDIALDAPVGRGGLPPASLVDAEGPFYAMEVQPSYVPPNSPKMIFTDWCTRITFTYGGISIDTRGHALTVDKSIIPGLLVAGVDAGGFSNLGYAGGLALAFVTGLWAAREITRELGLPEPRLPAADARDAAPINGRL